MGAARHLILTLSVVFICLGLAGPAFSGAVERSLIEESLEEIGVPEADRKAISRMLDAAVTGIRRYLSSRPPAKGNPIRSTPNPLEPLITVAANLDTISCGSTLLAINSAYTDMVIKLAKESRDPTAEEIAFLKDLETMRLGLIRACNPSDKPTNGDGEVETPTHTVERDAEPEQPEWPGDWSAQDISCHLDCSIPHQNYVLRADNSVTGFNNALELSRKDIVRRFENLSREVIEQFKANPLKPNACKIVDQYASGINKALKKNREYRATAKANLEHMDKFYKDEVVACVKKCSERVQIKLAHYYPETIAHQELRLRLLTRFPIANYQCDKAVEWIGHFDDE